MLGRRPISSSSLLRHFDQLDIEDEYGIGGDASGDALAAVALVGGDGQLGALTLGHLGQTLFPSGNNLWKKGIFKNT